MVFFRRGESSGSFSGKDEAAKQQGRIKRFQGQITIEESTIGGETSFSRQISERERKRERKQSPSASSQKFSEPFECIQDIVEKSDFSESFGVSGFERFSGQATASQKTAFARKSFKRRFQTKLTEEFEGGFSQFQEIDEIDEITFVSEIVGGNSDFSVCANFDRHLVKKRIHNIARAAAWKHVNAKGIARCAKADRRASLPLSLLDHVSAWSFLTLPPFALSIEFIVLTDTILLMFLGLCTDTFPLVSSTCKSCRKSTLPI